MKDFTNSAADDDDDDDAALAACVAAVGMRSVAVFPTFLTYLHLKLPNKPIPPLPL